MAGPNTRSSANGNTANGQNEQNNDMMNVMMGMLQNQQQQTTLLQQQLEQQNQNTEFLIQQNARPTPGIRQFRALDPKTFNGEETPLEAEEWLRSTTDNLKAARIPEEDWVDIATLQLTHNARSWWIAEKGRLTAPIYWETFEEQFNEKFFSVTARRQLREKFLALKQNQHTVDEYDAEFSRLSVFAPQIIADPRDRAEQFLQGLNWEIQGQLVSLGYETHAQVLMAARKCEAYLKRKSSILRNSHTSRPHNNPPRNNSNFKRNGNPRSTQQSMMCNRCNKPGHIAKDCRQYQCYRCGSTEHFMNKCPVPPSNQGQNTGGSTSQTPSSSQNRRGPSLPTQQQAYQKRQTFTMTAEEVEDDNQVITGKVSFLVSSNE